MSFSKGLITWVVKNRQLGNIISHRLPGVLFKSIYRASADEHINWNGKKACFTMSFDVDLKKDIDALPILLDTLSSYSFRTAFACIGKHIENHPTEHRKILDAGHEILNHTYTHPDNEELNQTQRFNELTIAQQKEEISKCHDICKRVLGYEMIGFRTPHFGNLHTDSVYPILKELNYTYSSSMVAARAPSFCSPYKRNDIWELPLSPCPKHPLGVLDTWHSLERGNSLHKKGGEFADLFRELMEYGLKTGSYINVYFDPQDVVGYRTFKDMLEYIDSKKDRIWISTYRDVVKTVSQ